MTARKLLLTAVCLGVVCAVIPVVSTHAATYTREEQSNIKVVTDFYAALDRGDAAGDLKQKIRGIAEQYLKPDYIQHSTQSPFGSGREALVRMFEQMPSMAQRNGGPPPPQPKVIALMATGDLVVRISARVLPGAGKEGADPMYIFNMFRVQDGKLAEHWDGSSTGGQMPLPPGAAPGSPPGAAPPSR